MRQRVSQTGDTDYATVQRTGTRRHPCVDERRRNCVGVRHRRPGFGHARSHRTRTPQDLALDAGGRAARPGHLSRRGPDDRDYRQRQAAAARAAGTNDQAQHQRLAGGVRCGTGAASDPALAVLGRQQRPAFGHAPGLHRGQHDAAAAGASGFVGAQEHHRRHRGRRNDEPRSCRDAAAGAADRGEVGRLHARAGGVQGSAARRPLRREAAICQRRLQAGRGHGGHPGARIEVGDGVLRLHRRTSVVRDSALGRLPEALARLQAAPRRADRSGRGAASCRRRGPR